MSLTKSAHHGRFFDRLVFNKYTDSIMDIKITPLENSEVEITGEIAADIFNGYRPKAIEHLGKDVDISGFRKGHIPENVLVQHVGEAAILDEMAQQALGKHYPLILKEHKIDAIGQPEVTITKIALDNPLGFKIKVATLPQFDLPNYNAIAKKIFGEKTNIEVTDKEIEDTIEEIRTHYQRTKEHTAKDEKAEGEKQEDTKPELPEITDEFVKTLGDFKDVADFKAKLKDGIRIEKTKEEHDKRRMKFLEEVTEKTKITLPRILIDGELDRMTAQFEGNVARAGGTLDDYLKQTGKTREDIRKEWEDDAQKRVLAQLALNKMVSEEKIEIPEEELTKEVDALKQVYATADPFQLRAYVQTMLSNERLFKKFEGVEEKGGEK